MPQRLTQYLLALLMLLFVASDALALVPLMPQDHPLCREVLKRERRDFVLADFFGKNGLEWHGYGNKADGYDLEPSLYGHCKGFMKGLGASTFQVYSVQEDKNSYYIFVSGAFSWGPYSDEGYYEHRLFKIDNQACTPERLPLALPTQTPLPYFMGYAVYRGDTYGIYTARHEVVNEAIESWVLDYESTKIIQNLSRPDGKSMTCRP